MSAIDRFNSLVSLRDKISRWRWSQRVNFRKDIEMTFDDGSRTSMKTISDDEYRAIDSILSATEYGGSRIAWCSSYCMGEAYKNMVLSRLALEIGKAASEAKSEAELVLKTLDAPRGQGD